MIDINKVAVITGAASGIGKATSEKYQSEGFEVVGIDIEPIPESFQIIKCDIRQEVDILAAFANIDSKFGHINYLVNAAGVFFAGNRNKIEAMSFEDWNNTMALNLTGTMMMTKHAIPLLRRANGDRAIINLSSDQARHPKIGNASYAVSKSGIDCLTKLCAKELLVDHIRVNSVAPASVKTNFIRNLAGSAARMEEMFQKEEERMPLGLINPQDVANLVFFLGSEQSLRITGQTISIDSGIYTRGVYA